MAKTLRVRTKNGWVTKPIENLPSNRLSATEIDDNFLDLEGQLDDIRSTEETKGAALVGYKSGSVKDALDNIDGNLNFTTLATAAPAADEDLMIIRQGSVNKKIDVGTIRTEFATEAVVAASEAESAKVAAETARDVAQLSAGVFADAATGLAATTNGKFFSVPSPDSNEYLILYKNNSGVAEEVKRYPSVSTVDVLKSKLPDIVPLGYVWALLDQFNRAAIGVKEDGTFDAAKASMEELLVQAIRVGGGVIDDNSAPGFLWSVSDGGGRVAFGILSDGRCALDSAYVSEGLKVAEHDMKNQSYPGLKWAIADKAGRVSFAVMDDGTALAKSARFDDLEVKNINGTPFSNSVIDRLGGVYSHQLNFINNAGQSLGEGSTPATDITTSQEYDNVGFPARSASPSALLPLTTTNTKVSGRGESPMYGTLGHIKELIARENGIQYGTNDYQLAACNNAYSGYSILQLNKGTGPYAAAISQVQAAFSLAQAEGRTMAFQAVTWTQGEADAGMAKHTYKGHLKQLAIDYNADGKSITGQFNDVKLICYQCATANRNIALAQLEASNESPLIYMACPMYQFEYGDNQHITAESSKWLGGYYGLAYKRVVVDRQDWQPLQPIGHAVNGNTVDLIFNKSGLVLDTTLVPAQVDYGFQVLDAGGAAVSITAISIVGHNRVRLTLAGAPAPWWSVRYGFNSAVDKGPFTGGCGNLRDSQGETIIYSAINKPMHNWCVIFNYSL